MIHQAIKVRLYPTNEQIITLSQHFGSARWWWNYALNKCIETYKETGKGLTRSALNSMLPKLKKEEETEWLKDCYSQVLQSVSLNLSRAYLNFFAGRAKYPRFKSKSQKQSIQYPQQVKQIESCLKFPGKLGVVKAKIHRPLDGEIKTVTVSMTPSGKYYASVLLEKEGTVLVVSNDQENVIGIDLGIKDFAITHDGHKTSKYGNPRQSAKHQKNLKRKQQKLARKKLGSNRRNKARKLAARVYERISNVRQDFLHKLSRKIVNNNQVVVVENLTSAILQGEENMRTSPLSPNLALNVKGMVRNHPPAFGIPHLSKPLLKGEAQLMSPCRGTYRGWGDKGGSDCSWGKFVNFLDYKLTSEGKLLVEIDRFFPSSKTCSNCHYKIDKLPLDVRNWTCPRCGTHHDRDENAAKNIRAEGIRIMQTSLGTSDAAKGGNVSPKLGRVSRLGNSL